MKKLTIGLLGVIALNAIIPLQAKAYDFYRCQHYYRAAKSYMKAARFDKAKEELKKFDREGCPSNVPME